MQGRTMHEPGVSEVVGEMLMIAVVLILVSVFSASLPNYLPSERSPAVTIRLCNDTAGNITLWHKGGDWMKADMMRLIVSNRTFQESYRQNDAQHPLIFVPDAPAFDLGGSIIAIHGRRRTGDEEVVLATDRAVIFSGKVTAKS